MTHRGGRKPEVLTKRALEEAFAAGIVEKADLAAHFDVHPDSIPRAMRRHGFLESHVRREWSVEKFRQASILNADGVPIPWIAETVDMPVKSITDRGFRRGAAESAAWRSVWMQILKNPVLLELHREFAPPTIAESVLRNAA